MRKDCVNLSLSTAAGAPRSRAAVAAAATLFVLCELASAGSVRIRNKALVTADRIRLDDVCVLSGFGTQLEQSLSSVEVADAPLPGQSREISLAAIRTALRTAAVNQADVVLQGAARCVVVRPTRPATSLDEPPRRDPDGPGIKPANQWTQPSDTQPNSPRASGIDQTTSSKLQTAVAAYFNTELRRFGGTAEVVFLSATPTTQHELHPDTHLRVRRKGAGLVGAVAVEVDVLLGDTVSSVVELDVRVSVVRSCVVARRAINQGAPVQAADVELHPMTLAQLDDLPASDTAAVVGQRAKKFVPEGAPLHPGDLEPVPVVLRGQLVSLEAALNGVRVLTTARAAQDGRPGEIIKVRAPDNKRVEFDALVVGPGSVRVLGAAEGVGASALALSSDP